jgi:ABC-type multidrug transport system ATPase subunit
MWCNLQVVYMDEPSTGLDPASRYNLWSVVKQSKQDRAIILTSKLAHDLLQVHLNAVIMDSLVLFPVH